MKIFNGKKGLDGFSLVLTMIAIIALTLILIGVILKDNSLSSTLGGKVGTNAFNVISSYDRGDAGLLYIDNAAKLSLQEAAYQLGKNGFYGRPRCTIGDLHLWKVGTIHEPRCQPDFSDQTTCLPENPEITNHLEYHFRHIMNRHIEAFNEKEQNDLSNNYEYQFKSADERTQVLGIAQEPYEINGNRVKYSVTPSFKESIDVDVIGDFEEIKSKVEKLKQEISSKVSNSENIEENDLNSLVSDFNSERLVWRVEGISKALRKENRCNTDKSCWVEINVEKLDRDKSIPDCSADPSGELLECPGTGISFPTITELKHIEGDLNRETFSAVALISIRIRDDNPDTDVKTFAYETGSEEYEYRFGLNWIETGDSICCVRANNELQCPPCPNNDCDSR